MQLVIAEKASVGFALANPANSDSYPRHYVKTRYTNLRHTLFFHF